MSLIGRMRKQAAVYWAQGPMDKYGRPTWQEPIQIKCRWEDRPVSLRTPQAETVTFNTVVYVDRPMQMRDRLKLGDLESSTVLDPTTDQDAHAIQRFMVNPRFDAAENLYTAYL